MSCVPSTIRAVATENELRRWNQVLDRILIPYDGPGSAVRLLVKAKRPFPHTQAVRVTAAVLVKPLTAGWEAAPSAKGSALSEWLAPAYSAAKSIDLKSTDTKQFVDYIELVRQARDRLRDTDPDNVTIDSVLRDLELDFKLAVLVARLGHNGILQLLDRRFEAEARAATRQQDATAAYLDLLSLKASDISNHRTMSYSDIRAMADPGVMTLDEYLRGDPEAERAPILKYFAAQWVTHMTTLWDEYYRPSLAEIHGCSKDDVGSELFADLNKIRQDYVHNRGRASQKQVKNKRLNWFQQGDLMIPTSENYEQLFVELHSELALLAEPPAPRQAPTRTSLKGQVPVDVRNLFEQVAAAAGLGIDAALEDALTEWIQARQQN
jgi:hypothetical protein